jgi:hypothetical protein
LARWWSYGLSQRGRRRIRHFRVRRIRMSNQVWTR